jgi:sugar-specific transcriptional regulator TrmB
MHAALDAFLEKLGLTEYEVKTLSTLFTLREADSPEVARAAQVPKTRVYDVLDALVEKGLVVKMSTRPKKYRALAPAEALQKLVDEKQNDLQKMKVDAQRIGKEIEQTQGVLSVDEKVLKVKSRTDFYKILAQEVDSAQKEVNGLTALDIHHHLLHDSLERAAQRNVSIKLSGIHPESFIRESQKWGKNIQLQDATPGLHAYVMDGKKVVLLLSDLKKDQSEYHFAIWPDNEAMAQTFQNTFDKHWEK